MGRDLILFLLYTGFRRSEATTLRWDDVDLDAGVVRLAEAATKSKRMLELPMSDIVRDLLQRRRDLGDTGWVFPANSKSGHVEEPRHFLEQVTKATEIDVSVHDLRRTFISVAEVDGDERLRPEGPGESFFGRRRDGRVRPALRRAAPGPRPAGGRRAAAALPDRNRHPSSCSSSSSLTETSTRASPARRRRDRTSTRLYRTRGPCRP